MYANCRHSSTNMQACIFIQHCPYFMMSVQGVCGVGADINHHLYSRVEQTTTPLINLRGVGGGGVGSGRCPVMSIFMGRQMYVGIDRNNCPYTVW